MPDIMYLLFIFILLYFCCLPRFEAFTGAKPNGSHRNYFSFINNK